MPVAPIGIDDLHQTKPVALIDTQNLCINQPINQSKLKQKSSKLDTNLLNQKGWMRTNFHSFISLPGMSHN